MYIDLSKALLLTAPVLHNIAPFVKRNVFERRKDKSQLLVCTFSFWSDGGFKSVRIVFFPSAAWSREGRSSRRLLSPFRSGLFIASVHSDLFTPGPKKWGTPRSKPEHRRLTKFITIQLNPGDLDWWGACRLRTGIKNNRVSLCLFGRPGRCRSAYPPLSCGLSDLVELDSRGLC